jgi:4-hydroxyphenylpyruvate dioxygenase-like putative hemolysin
LTGNGIKPKAVRTDHVYTTVKPVAQRGGRYLVTTSTLYKHGMPYTKFSKKYPSEKMKT